jgi:hypothetical protein
MGRPGDLGGEIMIDYLTIAEAIRMLKEDLEEDPRPLTFELIEEALIEAFLEKDPSFHVGSRSYDHVLFRNDLEIVRAEKISEVKV